MSEKSKIIDTDVTTEHDEDTGERHHQQFPYISIFSGIEAASRAFEPLGWYPVAFSEYASFPSAVLEERYPSVPNLGDITSVDWSSYKGTVDLIVGGSPCQTFSLAGNRTGLAGASGLMWEYIRAVRDVRPDWFLWENVPGALSADHGDAYQQLLENMDSLGYGMAWRVLDSQFFGVAQRRSRLFLVGRRISTMPPVDGSQDDSSTRAANTAARVLFESTADLDCHESIIGHRNAVAAFTDNTDNIIAATGSVITHDDTNECVTIGHMDSRSVDSKQSSTILTGAITSKTDTPIKWLSGGMITNGKYWMIRATEWPRNSRVAILSSVLEHDVDEKYNISEKRSRSIMSRAAKHGKKIPAPVLHVLEARAGVKSGVSPSSYDANDHQPSLTPWDYQSSEIHSSDSVYPTMSAGAGKDGFVLVYTGDKTGIDINDDIDNIDDWTIRLLTPVECERLMGFPDGWTDVTYHEKPAKNDPRYTALGNSMVVNVMAWIGEGIRDAETAPDNR